MPAQDLPKIYLYRRIILAKIFIDEHYAGPIDLNDIAGEAYFSKFHFIRLFKKAYGKTPHQYLTIVRIENAKLLLQKNIPVAEVCYSVGFDAISSFTHLFKRINKVTPSVYQQHQRLRKAEINSQPLKFIPNCFAAQNGWA
ncbi:MAG: AraC family transcriptional regulator [Ginsengibacter sp.]